MFNVYVQPYGYDRPTTLFYFSVALWVNIRIESTDPPDKLIEI